MRVLRQADKRLHLAPLRWRCAAQVRRTPLGGKETNGVKAWSAEKNQLDNHGVRIIIVLTINLR